MRAWFLLPLLSLGVSLGVGACGASSGAESSPTDGGAEATNGADATSGSDGGDAASDARQGDTGTDAGTPQLQVELHVDTLYQDCMPIVASDPVTFQGTLTIKNNGTGKVGPMVFASGKFVSAAGATLATFRVDTTTQVIPGGGGATVVVEKTAASMSPSNGCATLACNSDVSVSLAFTGDGVPPGSAVSSLPAKVTCAF